MTTSPNPTVDHLIYEATDAESTLTWTLDTLADAECADHSEREIDALNESRRGLADALRPFTHYSNHRPITTTTEIEPGSYFTMQWSPIVGQPGERLLTEGDRRPWGPGDTPGRYQVYVTEETCTMRIVLLSAPARPFLAVVK